MYGCMLTIVAVVYKNSNWNGWYKEEKTSSNPWNYTTRDIGEDTEETCF